MSSLFDSLESKSARARLEWAVNEYGESLLFTSSFGAGSAVLLKLWSDVARGLPIVFLDTGFHFNETLEYRDRMINLLGLHVEVIRPEVPAKRFLAIHGDDIQKRNSDLCCGENKVAPLKPSLVGKRGWISGLRRDQSQSRGNVPIALPTQDGVVK
ncbi:MAG: phosphoadenosine phosphosulfate reductase family protein, partial [Polyangiaceae bacterium]